MADQRVGYVQGSGVHRAGHRCCNPDHAADRDLATPPQDRQEMVLIRCLPPGFPVSSFHQICTHIQQINTNDSYNVFLWTAIEPCTGIVAACLPPVAPLFKDKRSLQSLFASAAFFSRVHTRNGSRESTSVPRHGSQTPDQKASSSLSDQLPLFRGGDHAGITLTTVVLGKDGEGDREKYPEAAHSLDGNAVGAVVARLKEDSRV
ncbi:MAG: hypothetical protein Q9160_000326 [Pyrenula sp. 1 TL-2023]